VGVDSNRSDASFCDGDNAVREDELQAYVDGQLDSRRRAAVEAYLAAAPHEAARLAAYRSQNIGLHALFDPLDGPGGPATRDSAALPPGLAALAHEVDQQLDARHAAAEPSQRPASRPKVQPTARRLSRLAASIALLVSASAAGWIALEQSGWDHDPLVSFTRQAAQTAPTSLQTTQKLVPALSAATPVATGGNASERQVAAWLAAQTGSTAGSGGAPTALPDLAALGFELVGERVITTAGGPPAAQLLYQDDTGQRVTLTMRAGGKAGQTSFTFARDGAASRFMWQDAHMAYSLVGQMEQDKLLRLAEAVSDSLRQEATPAQGTAAAPAGSTAGAEATESTVPSAPAKSAPAAPLPGVDPAIELSPLIPVPLPEADDTAKET
jgi:anti-sigma factor RsiW